MVAKRPGISKEPLVSSRSQVYPLKPPPRIYILEFLPLPTASFMTESRRERNPPPNPKKSQSRFGFFTEVTPPKPPKPPTDEEAFLSLLFGLKEVCGPFLWNFFFYFLPSCCLSIPSYGSFPLKPKSIGILSPTLWIFGP